MHLREARAKRQKTQWDLRLLTGIHQSKISLIERGYIVPTKKEKIEIAASLEISFDEIDWDVSSHNKIAIRVNK